MWWQENKTLNEALVKASRSGDVEAMKVLIDKGAKVNFANGVSAALAASIARTAAWRVCRDGG